MSLVRVTRCVPQQLLNWRLSHFYRAMREFCLMSWKRLQLPSTELFVPVDTVQILFWCVKENPCHFEQCLELLFVSGPCETNAFCTGVSGTCPSSFVSGGTLCATSQGPCEADQRCTGSSSSCPRNFLSSATKCANSTGSWQVFFPLPFSYLEGLICCFYVQGLARMIDSAVAGRRLAHPTSRQTVRSAVLPEASVKTLLHARAAMQLVRCHSSRRLPFVKFQEGHVS